ncbi:hypothetical protein CAEBREN_15407 [Caenorhabditis brenneri]|uniref:Uncharacterized protein n=1 Tax=Caenorhabditis brenneri TaxID=135651 RepID=G0P292_CAEBE|nr:hypothetical protein CAEBREN_15407 [Caenorhabditis brenneri]
MCCTNVAAYVDSKLPPPSSSTHTAILVVRNVPTMGWVYYALAGSSTFTTLFIVQFPSAWLFNVVASVVLIVVAALYLLRESYLQLESTLLGILQIFKKRVVRIPWSFTAL